jgi:hypothetical protein
MFLTAWHTPSSANQVRLRRLSPWKRTAPPETKPAGNGANCRGGPRGRLAVNADGGTTAAAAGLPAALVNGRLKGKLGSGWEWLRQNPAATLEADVDQSSRLLGVVLAAPGSTPSRRAARREQAVLLADALDRLPEQ